MRRRVVEIMNSKQHQFGVIGAGAWGTAIARHLSIKGYPVRIWCKETETSDSITKNHVNSVFLPEVLLPETLEATTDLLDIIRNTSILLVATPSHFTREIARIINHEITTEHILVILTKGIEQNSLALMSEIFQQELVKMPKIAVLSGPTFAREVAQDLPSAAVLACNDIKTETLLHEYLHSERLRLYKSNDLIGVQLGGTVKNVIAISSGIANGMKLGMNARAALICRGIAEMTRLGTALGGQGETFVGMSGIGDLILTATGDLSRNYTLGQKLGSGLPLEKCLPNGGVVVEGVRNAVSINTLAELHQIEMPLCRAVYGILYEGVSCVMALQGLLERDLPDQEISAPDYAK